MIDRLPPTPFYIRVTSSPQDLALLDEVLDHLSHLNWHHFTSGNVYKGYLSSSNSVLIHLEDRRTDGRPDHGTRTRPVLAIADALALMKPNSY